jgi:cytidylate kinase
MDGKITIAIDGFAGCGKSTTAKRVAQALGYVYIDTGAMYRAVTLHALEHGIHPGDGAALTAALPGIHLTFDVNPATGQLEIRLNGRWVEHEIRTPRVAEHVSAVSAVKAVRTFLVDQQRQIGAGGGVVMDGRDIGTVVFPNAELKVFITSSIDVRARRRLDELTLKGETATLESVRDNLLARDHQDSTRAESPLRRAADARDLDTSDLTIAQQTDQVLAWARALLERHPAQA